MAWVLLIITSLIIFIGGYIAGGWRMHSKCVQALEKSKPIMASMLTDAMIAYREHGDAEVLQQEIKDGIQFFEQVMK